MDRSRKKSSSLLCCVMPNVSSPGATAGVQDPGLQRLLCSLDQLETKADGTKSDLLFLKELLQSVEFQNLLDLHDKVTTPEAKDPPPIYESAQDLVAEVEDLLSGITPCSEARDLGELLEDIHLRALLEAHDMIALKDFQPALPEVPYAVDEDEESVKIVRLVKGTEEPLGATIQMDEDSGKIKIARVMLGGAADRSGLIQSGDEVHEVNKVKVAGKSPTEVVQILSHSTGPITLKLVPGDADSNENRESRIRVRALFDYNPVEDKYIPCKEAGLAFVRGDVLHIVCQDDPNWWQARKEGDKNLRAGLIPGKLLQERKELLRTTIHGEPKYAKVAKFSPKLGKKSKKSKKLSIFTSQSDDLENEEILTYEEVDRYIPKSGDNRTIVLIGPSGVGCTTLQNALIQSNPDRFTKPHLCTNLPKKSGDADGENYVHMTKQEIDKAVQNKLYFEHWEYKGYLYGQSADAVKSIIHNKRVPVITCSQPQGLRYLRTEEIKPYVVYVKPPTLSDLKSTRSHGDKHSKTLSEDDLMEMVDTGDVIYTNYGHYVDYTLENNDKDSAIQELLDLSHRIQAEAHWVPSAWT